MKGSSLIYTLIFGAFIFASAGFVYTYMQSQESREDLKEHVRCQAVINKKAEEERLKLERDLAKKASAEEIRRIKERQDVTNLILLRICTKLNIEIKISDLKE